MTASAAWSVPTTSSRCWPAAAYWTTIRSRALMLPRTKSVGVSPSASATALVAASEVSLMLMTMERSGSIKRRATWASSSSACTPYGSRTAMNSAATPSSRDSCAASWHSRPASALSCPPEMPRTNPFVLLALK
ncbi:Uncharacterised protein [Mycobacteroides abscessus subsp. abscessus]|nr:Uncharacterised protein [Mycobacteroides abscessus subsp. abscessus]